MQDDDAFDRGIMVAQATGQPYYTGMYLADGTMCLHDETGRFPDKPDGCYEQWRADQDSRHDRQHTNGGLGGIMTGKWLWTVRYYDGDACDEWVATAGSDEARSWEDALDDAIAYVQAMGNGADAVTGVVFTREDEP